jgi:hypothetical protein
MKEMARYFHWPLEVISSLLPKVTFTALRLFRERFKALLSLTSTHFQPPAHALLSLTSHCHVMAVSESKRVKAIAEDSYPTTKDYEGDEGDELWECPCPLCGSQDQAIRARLAPAQAPVPYFTRSGVASTNGPAEAVQPIGLVAYSIVKGLS